MFALQGTPCIIWMDAGLNIARTGKDIVQSEMKIVSALDMKFSNIKFRVTLPKHHEGIGAVEHIMGVIKNTVSKSLSGPNLIKMDDEELHTWLVLLTQKVIDRPLILGAPQGITITPNHILHGFRNTHRDEINLETTVQQQLNRWHICLKFFKSL